jgi:hypothetical protein
MALELLTMFVVPVLYAAVEESKLHGRKLAARLTGPGGPHA